MANNGSALPQRLRVDPQQSQRRAVAEEVRCDSSAFRFRHELVQSVLDRDDALVERQRLQLARRQP
jgi:hypothetical protein